MVTNTPGRHLQHLVDGLYEQAFAPFTSGNPADGGSTGFQSLPVNVWQTDEAYLATLMAPGLDEQTINVTVHEDTLAIEGALAFEAPKGARAVVWQEFGPASQAALGRRTSIDRSDVVAALNELADRGLVQRSADPDDRRRNVITITPAGRRQLRKLDQVLAGVQEKLLAPLSAADRARLIRLLNRLLEHDAQQ